MKKVSIILALILSISSTAVMASNNEEDVKKLVNDAVSFFQDKGQDYSVKAFNALHGPFVKGPLYVFVGTLDGRIVAHPFSKKLLEGPVLDMTDTNGKLLFKDMLEIVKNQGEGWTEYTWPYPGTKEPTPKRSFVKKIPSQDIWIGAGYYVK
jgi:cytochrome c